MGRILHFGLGNFARAHLLDYTQDAGGWDVVGVSLRSAGMRDGLAAQGFDYTLAVQGQDNKRIDILRDVLVAPENPSAVLQAIADPQVQIISATVTEKGYLFDAGDVATQPPSSFIAFLARGLAQRRAPVTVMSCDNQVANGAGLKAAVERFAQAAQIEIPWALLSWPNAMVDRITPATTQALREATSDPMAVPTEPFREWVIEDDFAGPRPDWPDAQIVQDVAAHELRKLRMLNGAHSLLAYAGVLKGHEFVHQAVADPDLRSLCEALMAEAAETLPAEVQPQAPAYAQALIARFENRHINHALRQIAMDGTQKLPYRFVSTLQARREMGLASPALEAGCAAWVAFCQQECGQGRALDDPKADLIAQACQSEGAEKALLDLVGYAEVH